MYSTYAEIAALINVASESHDLEFKRGDALDKISQSATRNELVRDVIALANAGGGTIIYGVEEDRNQPTALAKGIRPVTNSSVTDLQLSQIIRTGVEPVFSQFNVRCIDDPNGRIIVITVDQADTAHQCKHDQKYYHRVGTQVQPMYDYEIRDVMNRRKAPRVEASLKQHAIEMLPDRHSYVLTPMLSNVGSLTARHWLLELIVPDIVQLPTQATQLIIDRERLNTLRNHRVLEFSSDREPSLQGQTVLLPGQSIKLDEQRGYPKICAVVDEDTWHRLGRGDGDILLRLYVDDCRSVESRIAFRTWCQF